LFLSKYAGGGGNTTKAAAISFIFFVLSFGSGYCMDVIGSGKGFT
jgi:hypothetical protein